MNPQIPDDLIYAAFFFVDIVGLSNPTLSTETQRTKIKVLNENIYDCQTFLDTPKENISILPTGDGMLIGFKDGLEQPIKLAIELHEKLANYNQHASSTEKIETRIGCNVGYIFVVKDVFGHINLWGPGAILARRVMDLGDKNHILLTSSMAEDLKELSEKYDKILHPLHDYKIKHEEEILIYSAYNDTFGNQKSPQKTFEKNKTNVPITGKNVKCEKIIFNMKIKDLETNFVKHERIYHFVNNSNEPIYEINIGIITNTEQEFENLNVKAFDEDEELKLSKILSHSPFSKEIIIKLTNPIFNGDSVRIIKILYNVQEQSKYFENLFLTNAEDFQLNFIIPYNSLDQEPKLYHIDSENNIKMQIKEPSKFSKGMSTRIQWQKNDGINIKDIIRLEW